MIEYILTRTRRRSIALYVREGVVEVRAPVRILKSEIDKFVVSKEKWIANKLAASQEQAECRRMTSME